ncbi:MAG: tRNA (adenosine(37)-N6)-threonylcarbamoyltransferase complex ATPase subunit type 1 TsaE [Bacteroidetes bacterium]|nr:tRNA (adenosine(37)-N6)-threonylcarbamoyltransferase complex ATPase subunit type 1 TsaE [Bacteroidota bacterium]MBV6462470.1 tRNA threonylcarbamoyladenosine biosynthesis protein TsaE [Flavobacteriales bacterium]WKZ74364.1 MAG: tRNA (adenosine(37)-N6)-threonylcarbamoyltransferase complex ATPase subunit type 1 TsaE [Vicingaceae bacterium]MCL4817016.1 tRNA (adenosine(37)-N6)-threonylcarbamoyltransferase complex ATPase subunit type 1 TsaE [Flavobacteriales bacterium]NOG94695.1 tRNA (adenosine(37
MEFVCKQESELLPIAQEILKQYNQQKIFIFQGEMGAGKTTLIKNICIALQSIDEASSPTFSLVNEYRTKDEKTLYHFDFYRIVNEVEALDMGIEEYLFSNSYCFIEWPEKINNLLPTNYVRVMIESENENRIIKTENV